MKPSLKARLERLARVPATAPARSGCAVDLVLRPANRLAEVRTIDAVECLMACGVTALKAKRALEAMTENGEAVVHVPKVECARTLASALGMAGIAAARIKHPLPQIDVRKLRERLGCPSASAFAVRFNLHPRTVEGWENGRPIDDMANTYLHAIQSNPDVIGRALEEKLD